MVNNVVKILVETFQNLFSKEGTVFFISTLPILELRGGVLAGYFMNLPPVTTSIISVLGNLLPIPFVLMFVEKVFDAMERHHILEKPVRKLRERARHKSKGLSKAEFWSLLIFVAIPLPGTGAWTGAMVAEVLQMERKKAFLSIALGVIGALLIMLIVSYGLLNQLGL